MTHFVSVKFEILSNLGKPAMTVKQPYHKGDLPALLLQAAEEELSETGLERFSLRATAKRANVSHAAPAHHFKDMTGLLSALAADGYRRLVEAQNRRQAQAGSGAVDQFMASGLGYIDFAEAHPALFQLMFASEKPDRSHPLFAEASMAAFGKLEREVAALYPGDVASATRTTLLMTSWSVVHGLAELIISGRAEGPLQLSARSPEQRDAAIRAILMRVHEVEG